MRIRNTLLWLGLLLVLGAVNAQIIQKERVLNASQTIFLRLGSRDPRSLIQGDYMALRYRVPADLSRSSMPNTGHVVFVVDDQQIATITRLHIQNTPLKQGEFLLKYQKRDGTMYIGTDAFFFQEGHAHYYTTARYGELQVSGSGESIMVGLRDEHLNPLGPAEQ
jgi:uncharacterized membrane-anchored protein